MSAKDDVFESSLQVSSTEFPSTSNGTPTKHRTARGTAYEKVGVGAFPAKPDYSSLSVRDLLDAREQYHVYLSSLENVVATAIGRYRFQKKDWYAEHPPDVPRREDKPYVALPRSLANSIVRPWSWPAVLVFVKNWASLEKLGRNAVPSTLYLSDGRVVPTCVLLATPDESPAPSVPGPSHASSLLGGGYSCLREHQGVQHLGTFGCLVSRDGNYYALTNRHVAGGVGEEVRAFFRRDYHRVGVASDIGVSRASMSKLFPKFPGDHTQITLDAGLVHVDHMPDWTAQAFGIGEIGEIFDATEQSITLDLIGRPVRAFGGTTGVIEGEIQALFFRYKSLGGFDYVTEVFIGPRTGAASDKNRPPFTRPGDSGALWFYDPPSGDADNGTSVPAQEGRPEQGKRARRLRPIAMQWGGQRMKLADGTEGAFALASFLSSISAELDVDVVRDWSTGHDEYWGKIGHFAIGWKACDYVSGALDKLLKANQKRLGFADKTISKGSEFRVGRDGFVPLADVPDYVWVMPRENEGVQHFADIDIRDIKGGKSMLERCFEDPSQLSARAWKEYFDGFAAKGVGPEEGCLPFRVWQIWEAMVDYLKAGDVIRFVAAGGVMAHYVGDASQPLHCSWLHHGVPPTKTVSGRKYPFPRTSPEFKAFKKTADAKIHAIYEETMLEVDPASVLAKVDLSIGNFKAKGQKIKSGHGAAVQIIRLMHDAQDRLSPKYIIDADDSSKKPQARANALWDNDKVQKATIKSLAESVKLQADLWTAAWIKGKGDSIAKSKLVQFGEDALEHIYRHDKKFVPSLSLDEMAESGDFEPPA